MAKNDWGTYLLWGGVAAIAYVIADSMGLLTQIKQAAGIDSESDYTRVSYYTRPTVNAPLGVANYSNAYIGTAYSLGQQSFSGDYNSINMWDR